MIDLLVKILINAVGVIVAVLLVPQIKFPAADGLLKLQGNWWQVIVVAVILALINSYLKPILKVLSFPITLLTMGLFAFILNAVQFLITASPMWIGRRWRPARGRRAAPRRRRRRTRRDGPTGRRRRRPAPRTAAPALPARDGPGRR